MRVWVLSIEIAQLNRSFLHDNSIIHRTHHTHCACKVTAFFLFQQIIVAKKVKKNKYFICNSEIHV